MPPSKGYVKRTNFNQASSDMLRILVRTLSKGSPARAKALTELRLRGETTEK